MNIFDNFWFYIVPIVLERIVADKNYVLNDKLSKIKGN